MCCTRDETTDFQPGRILLVDDHPIVRFALARLMSQERDLTVCGEAGTAEEALKAIPACHPNIVLVDVSLGDSDGIELTRAIHTMDPALPVLVLSMHDEAAYAQRAATAGASGYVMKQEAPETILEAVRTVLHGGRFLRNELPSPAVGA
jgi:DNA-binding NarL/FixJ family response regulator